MKRTAIITGARSDVARAAATAMARSGARVILVSSSASAITARDEVAKRGGTSDVHLLLADMSIMSSVRELARQICDHWGSVSVLIHHSAHHNLRGKKREVTSEGFERFWAHNHLGPFLLTHLLKDALMKAHGRVITIGSTRLKVYPRLTVEASDPNFARRSYSAMRAFYQSKLAQIEFALALRRHWHTTSVIAKSLCVPSVGSDSTRRDKLPWYRRLAHQTAPPGKHSARKIGELYAVVGLSPRIAKLAGTYLDRELEEAWAPGAAFDEKEQDAVWRASAKAVL